MSNLLDDLFSGAVSRRTFIGLASKAGLALPMANLALAEVAAQTAPRAQDSQKFSPSNIGGGGRLERDFYRDWIKTSKVPMVEGYSILDAKTQEVQPWPDIGGRGVYLNFSGNVHMDTAIWEIPSGKALIQRHHFYEQIVYVLSGRGYTTFTQGKRQNSKFEWAEGSLFSIPMNLVHRHFNSDSAHPARLLVISTFPYALQSFGSVGLLNNMQYNFNDRFDGSSDYFKRNERIRQRWEQANFVKDVRSAEVVAWEERGEGNASMFWDMAGNTILEPHISEFEVASYKLGHRHPYEAIILTLNGRGFSLAGKNNLKDNEAVKMDWKAGSVVSPPFFWFHQHFNTGITPARYLAITEGDFPKRLGIPLEVEQIEKEQEDPAIRRLFDAELQKARQQGSVEDHEHHDHDIAEEHGHDGHHHNAPALRKNVVFL